MRFALAQVNPTVGDLEGNADLVLGCMAEARRAGAQVVVFPELVLSGYPPEDLLLREQFVRDCGRALDRVAAGAHGYRRRGGGAARPGRGRRQRRRRPRRGRVQAVYRKIWLPNYAVFDEQRYFESGDAVLVLELPGVRVGVNICEDIWEPCGPTEAAALRGGADVVVNLSMSPYHLRKGADRERMLRRRATRFGRVHRLRERRGRAGRTRLRRAQRRRGAARRAARPRTRSSTRRCCSSTSTRRSRARRAGEGVGHRPPGRSSVSRSAPEALVAPDGSRVRPRRSVRGPHADVCRAPSVGERLSPADAPAAPWTSWARSTPPSASGWATTCARTGSITWSSA